MKESDIRDAKVMDEYVRLLQKDVKRIFDFTQFVEISCPACGGDKLKKEFDKHGFTYVSCANCGTLFANPRPTPEQLDRLYSQSDSGKFFTEKFFMPYAETRKEQIFRPRAEKIVSMFPECSGGRIGDIGAGHGIFLEELKEKWSEAALIAIEPSEDMAKVCREKGLRVIEQMFENVEIAEKEQFDLLCSFELFEHLFAPRLFLEKCNSVLKMNGCLFVSTLNGKGFDIQLLWERHKNVNPPVHLNFFNLNSIRILLEQCGFEVIEATTPGKLDWNIVEESSRRGEIEIDRFWTQVMESDEGIREELQNWISRSNFSSHMQIIAKKVKELDESFNGSD